MNQELWKHAQNNEKEGGPGKCQMFWPWILLCPAMVFGALVMVMTLSVGWSHAFEGHGCQKFSNYPAFDTYSQDHTLTWDRPLRRLGGDNDDDDDDDADEGSS